MQIKTCAACGKNFQVRAQTPGQCYCSHPVCQRARRSKWQREKRKTDLDYIENQTRAQKAWSNRNSDYWKNYRTAHPDYVEQNRKMQHGRNARASIEQRGEIAKMDASNASTALSSGVYQLRRLTRSGIAKMDVWTVELRVVSHTQ